jgi:hypothetical protein
MPNLEARMNGTRTMKALASVACVALGVGCAAPVEGPVETASGDGKVDPQALSLTPVAPIGTTPGSIVVLPPPGSVTLAPSPVPVSCQRTTPIDVIRLPTNEGAPKYNDGFTVPFPTPGTLAAAQKDASLWPIYKYETALTGVSGVAGFEYLVRTAVLSGGEVKALYPHNWFVVDLTPSASTSVKTLLSQDPEWTQAPVEAQVLHCVHVWDLGSNNLVRELPGGPVWFEYADEHDPSTHPT